MSKSPYDIILHPLFSEKSSELRDAGKVTFVVLPSANKVEIRKAVEKLFEVSVKSIRTQIVRGKVKRFGRNMGKKPNWKKAIVTLKEGHNIEFFETE